MAIDINPGLPIRHVATFTSAGNYTPPAGIKLVFISMHSSTGGGGGGGFGFSSTPGSPGGAGLVAGAFVEVIPGVAHPIVIGAGGNGGAGNVSGARYAIQGQPGNAGGITSFDGTSTFAVTGSGGGSGGAYGNPGSTGAAANASGTTSLTALSPASAGTRVKTIVTQATGGATGGAGGNGGDRYAFNGNAGSTGSAGLVHVYI